MSLSACICCFMSLIILTTSKGRVGILCSTAFLFLWCVSVRVDSEFVAFVSKQLAKVSFPLSLHVLLYKCTHTRTCTHIHAAGTLAIVLCTFMPENMHVQLCVLFMGNIIKLTTSMGGMVLDIYTLLCQVIVVCACLCLQVRVIYSLFLLQIWQRARFSDVMYSCSLQLQMQTFCYKLLN